MLTFLEVLLITANIPVLIWALLPVRRVPRLLDFMPLTAVVILMLHLFIDTETLRFRLIPLYIFTLVVFFITIIRIFRHNPNQPKRRALAVVGRILGLIALSICVLIPTVILPFYPLPEPTGNFDTGTVSCDFYDEDRIEMLSGETGKHREIAVQFWYPADRTGDRPAYDVSGAALSAALRQYPVLVFSHGAFGLRLSNASTFRELASHGYIVASIDHTYHSFFTSFEDGRGVPANMEFINEAVGVSNGLVPADETFEITHEWLELRTGDVNLVLNALKTGQLDGSAAILNGHIDNTKIGLFGHSLGGAASAQVCRDRDDIGAVIVVDGTMIGDITGLNSDGSEIILNDSFKKPLMLMYNSLYLEPEGKEDSYLPNINAFSGAAGDAFSLCIKDSGHLNFTDLPRISPFLAGMLGTGTVDPYRCIEIMNSYTLAFFDKYLKGDDSTLLDAPVNYEEVVLDKR